MRRNAFGEVLAGLLLDLGSLFGLAQAAGVLLHKRFQIAAVDDVERIERVALALAHLLAFGVAHEAVDVDVLKRCAAGEVLGHHHHARDPEEDDVVARNEHARGQIEVVGELVLGLGIGAAQGREGNERGAEPRIEHVLVAGERNAVSGLRLGLFLGLGHVDVALVVVPGRNLMAPPELAADAPVLDVFKPLLVDALPLLGEDVHFARGDGFKTDFGNGLPRVERALRSGLAHGHGPLLGEHRLDDFARAGDARHHVLDGLDAHEKPQLLEVFDGGLTAGVAVHPAVLLGDVFVHLRGLGEHVHHREVVALADLKVVEVVRRRDLHAARAEFAVDVFVGDDGNLVVGQGELQHLAHERFVALVFGMHGHGLVAKERLGTGRGNDHAFAAVGARIADFPQEAVGLLAFDFKVAHGALQLRVPVDEALPAVDEAFAIERHEDLLDGLRELVVHREVKALPVKAVAQAAHLIEDGAARNFLPVPDAFDELLAAELATVDAFLLQLALDHDLRGDAGVIGARQPERVVAHHAVVAHERVHDGLVEGVPHVQDAGDVGRRKLDAKARFLGVETSVEVAALLPDRIPARLNVGGLEALG